MSVSPPKIYEVNGQVCKVKSKFVEIVAGAGSTTIITAITGQIIRVMGVLVSSAGAAGAGAFVLQDGSGGTSLLTTSTPDTTKLPGLLLPIVDSGYFETTVSVGLYGVAAAANQYANIFYITYAP
jgi:hypothetical protein